MKKLLTLRDKKTAKKSDAFLSSLSKLKIIESEAKKKKELIKMRK